MGSMFFPCAALPKTDQPTVDCIGRLQYNTVYIKLIPYSHCVLQIQFFFVLGGDFISTLILHISEHNLLSHEVNYVL